MFSNPFYFSTFSAILELVVVVTALTRWPCGSRFAFKLPNQILAA